MNEIYFIDRVTKKVCREDIYGRWALSLLYGNSFLARLFSFFFLPLIARLPICSRLYGNQQKKVLSKRKIAPFIKAYHINPSEFVDPIESFQSFNDFFIRKLKAKSRPIDPRRDVAIMPSDGRYLVIPKLSSAEHFYVKGQRFNLDSFLRDSFLAERFRNGAMLIARLNPTDYHRFHFPVDGIARPYRTLPGPLFSVTPIALARRFSILWENKRMITEIDSKQFGSVLMVEIGATCVGTIHQTYVPDQKISKGEEKGYFSFGGSCIVLLFEKGRIVFDEDLILNSASGLETKGLFGTSLGSAR